MLHKVGICVNIEKLVALLNTSLQKRNNNNKLILNDSIEVQASLLFYVGAENLNLDPRTCTAYILVQHSPVKPSAQPKNPIVDTMYAVVSLTTQDVPVYVGLLISNDDCLQKFSEESLPMYDGKANNT